MTHHVALAIALSLKSAIAQALPRDPAVVQARAEMSASAADARAVAAGGAPQLFASYSNVPQGGAANTTIAQHLTEIGVNKTFAFPGQLSAQVRAARSTQAASVARLARAEREAVTRIVGAYLDASVAEQRAAIADDAVASAKRLLDAANLRLRSGAGPKIDVDQAEAAYASAQAAQADADGKRDAAYAALDLAVGIDATAHPRLDDPDPEEIAVPDDNAAIAAALHAREDPRAADDDVLAAAAALRAVQLSAAPSLDLSAARQSGVDSGVPISGGTISVSVHVPIDVTGVVRAQVERARADYERAVAAREALRRTVVLDVESAIAGVRSTQLRVNAERRAVDAARSAAAAADLGFRHGATSAVDALIAQSQYVSTRGDLISAEADAIKARYALRLAEGVDVDVTP